jgi:2-succinyl-6-hydroxy-2,4-cyclohexadiene-1-carboxylate synthase
LDERVLPRHTCRQQLLEELKKPFVDEGIYNETFRPFLDSCVELLEDGSYTSHYKNHVQIEYIQKCWDIEFENYYKKIKCPVLFIPSTDEWNNEKIRNSLAAFSNYLTSYEVQQIPNTNHAYVWMEQPKKAAGLVKEFIESL